MFQLTLQLLLLISIGLMINCAPVDFHDLGKFDWLVRPALFEGDLAGIAPKDGFTTVDQVNKYFADPVKNGIVSSSARWPGNIMYYAISTLFTDAEAAVITKAVKEINDAAVNFVLKPRTDASHYVFIGRGAQKTGCWSYVGKQGGRQELNLEVSVNNSPHCMIHGIIVHELMHAVGFYHEQSRTDRDDFVEINFDNIAENQKHNFAKYTTGQVNAFGQRYDYDSLMHYGRHEFAMDPKVWTVQPKKPNEHLADAIGQRRGLSEIDAKKMNAMYPKTL